MKRILVTTLVLALASGAAMAKQTTPNPASAEAKKVTYYSEGNFRMEPKKQWKERVAAREMRACKVAGVQTTPNPASAQAKAQEQAALNGINCNKKQARLNRKSSLFN